MRLGPKTILFTLLILLIGGLLSYGLVNNLKPARQGPSLEQLIPRLFTQKENSANNPPPLVNIESLTQEEASVISAVDKSLSAVVSIVVTRELPVYERLNPSPFNDPFVCDFFGQDFCDRFEAPELRQNGTQEQQVGAGTGFFVTRDGMIATNKHVVSRQDVDYTVITSDGERHEAQVLAIDPVNDLALIRVQGSDFNALPLGDSSQAKLGQTVIAIGNALGQFSNTVSKGIISGLSRSVVAQGGASGPETLTGVIQTDAAINPGNSGGPLLDLAGNVIGINTAVAGGAQNIGFALPVNLLKRVISQYNEKGEITYPFLGIRYLIVTGAFAREQNLPVDHGALIVGGQGQAEAAVIPGSPAARAGLQEGDIILEINGEEITQANPLDKVIAGFDVGDNVTLRVYSNGGTKTINVTLAERS